MGKTRYIGAAIVVAACIIILSAVVCLRDTVYYQPMRWTGIILFFTGIVMVPAYSAKENPEKRSNSLFRVFMFIIIFPREYRLSFPHKEPSKSLLRCRLLHFSEM